jgi:hypothetical protein
MGGVKRGGDGGAGAERLAREVVRAAASAGEAEAEAVAASPFLYARVRARVAEERRRREEGDGWIGLLAVALRAAPAAVVAAAVALALFLSSGELSPAGGGLGDDALLVEREGDIEQVVFADARAPSPDEVLSTIIGEGEGSR